MWCLCCETFCNNFHFHSGDSCLVELFASMRQEPPPPGSVQSAAVVAWEVRGQTSVYCVYVLSTSDFSLEFTSRALSRSGFLLYFSSWMSEWVTSFSGIRRYVEQNKMPLEVCLQIRDTFIYSDIERERRSDVMSTMAAPIVQVNGKM